MLFIASSNFVVQLSAYNKHKVSTADNVLNQQVIFPHACSMYMEIYSIVKNSADYDSRF